MARCFWLIPRSHMDIFSNNCSKVQYLEVHMHAESKDMCIRSAEIEANKALGC